MNLTDDEKESVSEAATTTIDVKAPANYLDAILRGHPAPHTVNDDTTSIAIAQEIRRLAIATEAQVKATEKLHRAITNSRTVPFA